ncbi:MAG: M20/M25/M40 family metallo-hydrolase [Mesorhizobium sp.]|nr:M20/M25/M40 family metallo-hydrolase [Mesorhizobium sp. M8A.F.Ca.ET.023.02.2.1]RWC70364.1 MAG: M20/M25/M40 family metallo-hydrolase [Mesorhizobium sp.]RWC75660.1 MAG: M20/M25/M40 family metallo-hydrolase [Mesorhizobium sp.]TGQ83891.1 M20/M25/M40 family metallo-hydrolase [Mesorhizobium sp. M8A.F.Ca.ET.207.01.1.1]TIT68411.1 MAG: M20/M25/M40 family metallo-hydrolase [Mesorhizobium sp.]
MSETVMNGGAKEGLPACAERWALALTERRSVTGSEDEASFGPWLAGKLRQETAFRHAEIWTIEVEPGDGRHCVAMLLRGGGRATVVLTGHYDTVTTRDYGELEELATRPGLLTPALGKTLATAETAAARRARVDFASGEFLAGRGLLDMKAGLAAGLAVCTQFAESINPAGNIFFLAVPDEENNSAGARRAAQALPTIADECQLEFAAAINLDAIADDGDGSKGRIIALGTVGKLLPTAYVVGVPAHSGFPLNGLNAATLAAAIATRVEWAPELTDQSRSEPGTPASLLSIRDGKAGYDVTTPASAYASFNVLSYRRTPGEVFDRFEQLCAQAASTCLGALKQRLGPGNEPAAIDVVDNIALYRYEAVADRLDGKAISRVGALGASLAASELSLPEQCRLVIEEAWRLSRLSGPAVVIGFGSIPYLPTNLSQTPAARRLRAIAGDIAANADGLYGCTIACADYFAGISDMSFFGEAAESSLDVVARNTPMWSDGVRWPAHRGLANIPTINIGPWGRDYHTPLERLHTGYAFSVLPRVLSQTCRALLNAE